ncbi:SCP-like protein [Ostertagia ostertagi]
MNETIRSLILEFHNNFRTNIAEGEAPGYEGKKQLPAQNLFKMIWSCALEEKAVELTKNCAHSVDESINLGQNIFYFYDGDYIADEGTVKAIRNALYQWTLPAQFYGALGFRIMSDNTIITYSNMVYHGIYEVGCNFVVCRNQHNSVEEAVLMCIYNTNVSPGTRLYQRGDGTGCKQKPDVCNKIPGFKCGKLLCELSSNSSAGIP